MSKIGRFDARDQEDIWSAIRKYGLAPRAIQERAANISYAANEKNYAYNLKLLLQQMRAK